MSGLYARSLHRDHHGEWDFDLAWKPLESWPVYAGWLRAIRRGHARRAPGARPPGPGAGAHLGPPASHSEEYDETLTSTDIVLDVEQIRRWVARLADHVTAGAGRPGAMHDVTLSREPVRERVFDEIGRWLDAYVD